MTQSQKIELGMSGEISPPPAFDAEVLDKATQPVKYEINFTKDGHAEVCLRASLPTPAAPPGTRTPADEHIHSPALQRIGDLLPELLNDILFPRAQR